MKSDDIVCAGKDTKRGMKWKAFKVRCKKPMLYFIDTEQEREDYCTMDVTKADLLFDKNPCDRHKELIQAQIDAAVRILSWFQYTKLT